MQQFPARSYGKAHADKELLLAWLFTNAGPDNANWFYVLSRRGPNFVRLVKEPRTTTEGLMGPVVASKTAMLF